MIPKDNNKVVIIYLDKPRELRFAHSALKKASKLTGVKLKDFETITDDLEHLEELLWCGLVHEDKDLKLEDMEGILDKAPNFAEILKKMGDALQASLGSSELEGEEKNG